MALPAANLFAAVVTSRFSAHPGSLCGLRVDYPGTGLGVSSEASSQALVDCLVHLFPGAVEAPSSEVVVDSLPRREVTRQKPPLAAALQDIENSVQDLAGAVDSWASSPFRGREVGLEIQPFGVGEVGRVALSHAPERTRSLCSGAFSNSLSRNCLINSWRALSTLVLSDTRRPNRAPSHRATPWWDPRIGPVSIYQTVSEEFFSETGLPVFGVLQR